MRSLTRSEEPDATIGLWLPYWRPNANARVQLWCFPFAGGSAAALLPWTADLPATVDLRGLELPGRGARMSERPITRLAPLVDMLMAAIRPVLQHPFALFGHSMGAVVAFEFARRLHALGEPAPVRLFVSGARAPHLPHPAASQAPPSDASVLAMVRTLGGVPEDLFRNPSLLDQLLPVWRADIGLHRSYEFRNGSVLDCPITAFAGTSDAEVSPPSVREWVAHTRGPFRLRIFDGDHFFIRPHQADVLREVRSDLERWLT